MLEETNKEFLKKIKEELLNGDEEIGFVITKKITYVKGNKKYKKLPSPDLYVLQLDEKLNDYERYAIEKMTTNKDPETPPIIYAAMPRKLFKLGKEQSIGFPKDIRYSPTMYDTEKYYENEFVEYDQCTEIGKKALEERRKAVEEFRKKVEKDNTGKYDKVGIIFLPKFKTNDNPYSQHSMYPEAKIEEIFQIEVTQRELAKAGILPKDFKWIDKAKVSAKDIADISKSLTTSELKGIEKLMTKLLDKLKGLGEK